MKKILIGKSKAFFDNYWFVSGTPSYLVKLLNQYIYDIPKDEDNIVLKVSELDKFEIDKIHLISLLFQAGYLTIESCNTETKTIKLKYPNEEVKDSFKDQIKEVVKNNIKELSTNLKLYFKNENWEKLFELFKSFYATIPYTETRNESWYATMFFQAFQVNDF